MPVRIIETRTSRSFSAGVNSAKGEWDYVLKVTGEAYPETAVLAAVAADCPFFWYNLSRRDISPKPIDRPRGLYTAKVDYVYEAPSGAASDPTHSPPGGSGPGGGTPSGTPSGPATDTTAIGPNVSLEIGGKPPKLFTSRGVLFSQRIGGLLDPTDRGRLLNVQDGKAEGIDVQDPASVLTIDVQYDRATMKFIKFLQSAVWHTNLNDWWHLDEKCVVFTGATLKTNDSGRVASTLRFGLRPGEIIPAGEIRDDLGNELPTADVYKAGWDYLDIYHTEVQPTGTNKITVRKPLEMYIHRVLPTVDFSAFGIGV